MDTNDHGAIARIQQPMQVMRNEVSYVPVIAGGNQVELHDMWTMIRRRWRLMLLTIAIVIAVGAAYTFIRKPIYESTAMVVVVTTPAVPTGKDDFRVMNDLLDLTRGRSVQSHLQLITSPEVLSEGIAQLTPKQIKNGFRASVVPKWAVRAEIPVRDSDIVSVIGRAYDPTVAADLANSVAFSVVFVFEDRFVVAHNVVDLADVNEAVPVDARHMPVALCDHQSGLLHGCLRDVDAHTKAHVAVPIDA